MESDGDRRMSDASELIRTTADEAAEQKDARRRLRPVPEVRRESGRPGEGGGGGGRGRIVDHTMRIYWRRGGGSACVGVMAGGGRASARDRRSAA